MKTTATLTQENDKLAADLSASQAQVASLTQQLDWFKRQIFGRKSEKIRVDTTAQGHLFTCEKDESPTPSAKKPVKAHTRRIKHKNDSDVNDTGLRFSNDVPQQIIDLPCPELDGEHASDYEIVGMKETCRLAQQVGSYVVLIYRRKVLKHKESETLSQQPAPGNVLDKCYCDVSLLAGLMVDKAVYHLPLHRQHQRMLDAGVTLSRATLLNYVSRGIELLRPIVQAMLQHMLSRNYLAMDEVPMKAGRAPSTGRKHSTMKQTYFWPIYGQDDEVVFTWSRGRASAHAIDQLTGFSGVLLSDGYSAYSHTVKKLNEQGQALIHASCWAHCRRLFEKAQDSAPNETEYVLNNIRTLYRAEKVIRDEQLRGDDIMAYRLAHSQPVIQHLFAWLDQQRQRLDLLPKDPYTKAIVYAHERRDALQVYLTHPQVDIDTNHLERALRVIPMGRKNHMFCWTELGAEQLGILHSLTVTCRLHNINPYTYLVDVLQRVGEHPASRVNDLTPRKWKTLFANKPLTSDVNPTQTQEYAA